MSLFQAFTPVAVAAIPAVAGIVRALIDKRKQSSGCHPSVTINIFNGTPPDKRE